MYIGNIMLLILNLPLIGLWVQLLKVPYPILMPLIIVFCVIGVYSIANSIIDVFFMLIFGVIGYLMRKLRYDAPPLILAYVLGPMLEYSLKQSLMVSRGSFKIFFSRPISATCLIIAIILVILPIIPKLRKKRPGAALPEEI
jgi:putative tricarboxylic transport membrane protein